MGGGPTGLEGGLPSFLKRRSSRAVISCQRLVGASRSTAQHGRRRGLMGPRDPFGRPAVRASLGRRARPMGHFLVRGGDATVVPPPVHGRPTVRVRSHPWILFWLLRTTLLVAPASVGACFVWNILPGSSRFPTVCRSGGLQLGRLDAAEREPVATGSGWVQFQTLPDGIGRSRTNAGTRGRDSARSGPAFVVPAFSEAVQRAVLQLNWREAPSHAALGGPP